MTIRRKAFKVSFVLSFMTNQEVNRLERAFNAVPRNGGFGLEPRKAALRVDNFYSRLAATGNRLLAENSHLSGSPSEFPLSLSYHAIEDAIYIVSKTLHSLETFLVIQSFEDYSNKISQMKEANHFLYARPVAKETYDIFSAMKVEPEHRHLLGLITEPDERIPSGLEKSFKLFGIPPFSEIPIVLGIDEFFPFHDKGLRWQIDFGRKSINLLAHSGYPSRLLHEHVNLYSELYGEDSARELIKETAREHSRTGNSNSSLFWSTIRRVSESLYDTYPENL